MENTSNNISLFRTLFLVKGILTLCFSLFFILYGLFGYIFIESIEIQDTYDGPPFSLDLIFATSFGLVFIIIATIGLIICVTFGILTLIASKYLKETKNYNFIFVVAIINCLTGILGILLGVFTLIELNKTEVKQLFNKA
jgi:hypothetical protein